MDGDAFSVRVGRRSRTGGTAAPAGDSSAIRPGPGAKGCGIARSDLGTDTAGARTGTTR